MITVFGISNCDTVKKARAWLEARGIDYAFHDYKKAGADPAVIAEWIEALGLDAVVNRAGTTFRKLSDADKAALGEVASAQGVLAANPSCIRRPILAYPGGLLAGFKEPQWAAAFA